MKFIYLYELHFVFILIINYMKNFKLDNELVGILQSTFRTFD